jgi:hypothetical protein
MTEWATLMLPQIQFINPKILPKEIPIIDKVSPNNKDLKTEWSQRQLEKEK